jgi:DNA mismatch repair protein MutS
MAVSPPPKIDTPKRSKIEDRLRSVHPDDLSPKEALQLIYELKEASQE